MIVLRILSAALGVMVLIGPPIILFGSTRPAFFAGWNVLAISLGLAIVAASFFLVAFAGSHIKKSALYRLICTGLLAIPFIGSSMMLWRGGDAEQLWISGLVLCFTILLFVVFAVPAARPRKHRPMRQREPVEPTLRPWVRAR